MPNAGRPEGAGAVARSPQSTADIRALFPRLEHETFINAAGGTPLSARSREGLDKYEDYWRLGPADGRGAYVGEMLSGVRERIARLIGAEIAEIALVHCTKEGEQIVLNGLPDLRSGGNVVTNDLHFGGSLHNLIGLREAGLDVRIVRSENFDLDLEQMAAAIDDRTALVSVTLVSNINGRIEPMRELADLAHAHGAYVYADIIQAAGIVPFDVHQLGIDFAAGNGYKWLFGPHGTGFFFARQDRQGTVLEDHVYPGHARPNYRPWVTQPDVNQGDYAFQRRDTAQRYEPGHHAYLCYAALYEGLGLIEEIGVGAMRDHAVALGNRLVEKLDGDRYPCISPHLDASPIVTFTTDQDTRALADVLAAERISVSGGPGQIRVSPAIYNTTDDIDLLAEVLNRA